MGDLAAAQALDLLQAARRAGAARWLAARMFEILGGWVATVAEPEVKIAFATQASHFGWHTTLWGERLPWLHGVESLSWVAPAPGVEPAVALLAEASHTVERLVGVHRVLLPRLIAAHSDHLDSASPVTDGPMIRTLRLVLTDEAEDQRAGERLLHTLLRTRADVTRAAACQAALETRFVEAGPLLG